MSIIFLNIEVYVYMGSDYKYVEFLLFIAEYCSN